MPDSTIESMVTAVVIEREQIGPKRYIATLTIVFDRARAGQYIGGMATGARARSAPLLTIPVLYSGGVAQVFEAPAKIRELGYALNQSVYISDWTRTQGHLYQDIQLVRTIMYLVLVLVIGVACFNIVSTLVMAVRDKASEIAILMTMGLSRLSVMGIFMVQGALNGLVGCALGGVIGIATAINLSAIARGIEQLLGIQLLSADVYFVDFLPSELHMADAGLVIATAFIMSLIATLYPAWKASQIGPAQALAGR